MREKNKAALREKLDAMKEAMCCTFAHREDSLKKTEQNAPFQPWLLTRITEQESAAYILS